MVEFLCSQQSYATNMVTWSRINVKTSLLRTAGVDKCFKSSSQIMKCRKAGGMCPRFQSNTSSGYKRTSVARIFQLLSIISLEMGWKWMKNVVLLDICLRELTLAPQWKQVIKEILGRRSATGPVKQTIPFFFLFCSLTREVEARFENAEAHFLVISSLNSRYGVRSEGKKKETLHEAFEVGGEAAESLKNWFERKSWMSFPLLASRGNCLPKTSTPRWLPTLLI